MKNILVITFIYIMLIFDVSADQCTTLDCGYTGPLEPTKGTLVVDDIRILSMNVQGQKNDWGDADCEARLRRTGQLIANSSPNYTIVGLNEVHPDYAKITCNGHAIVDGIQQNGEYGSGQYRWGHPESPWYHYDGGLALFSTSTFEWSPYEEHVHTYDFNPKSRTTSGFIFAQINITDDVTVDVYVTHLHSKNSLIADCSRDCRYSELEELARGIHERSATSGNPVLIMGDFNIDGPNPSPSECSGNCGYSDIMDVLRNPRDLWLEKPTLSNDGETHEGRRIDYIFVPSDSYFSNSDYEIFLSGREGISTVKWVMDNGDDVSDHYGLSATIEIREKVKEPPECRRPRPTQPRICPPENNATFKQESLKKKYIK